MVIVFKRVIPNSLAWLIESQFVPDAVVYPVVSELQVQFSGGGVLGVNLELYSVHASRHKVLHSADHDSGAESIAAIVGVDACHGDEPNVPVVILYPAASSCRPRRSRRPL